MSKLSHLSKFLHGRRRKKIRYLLSKFRTKSGVNISIASLFQTAVDAAFKLRASSIEKYKRKEKKRKIEKYRIDVCSQMKPIAYCELYGIGIHFNPSNFKHKPCCGSDDMNLSMVTVSARPIAYCGLYGFRYILDQTM